MITCNSDSIELEIPVALALLAFASKDNARPHLHCVGIDQGTIGATDGHRAVAFGFCSGGASTHHGKVWARDHVETLIKVAKAHKLATIALRFDACAKGVILPPLSRVMPEPRMTAKRAVGFDPKLMSALELACKACGVKGAALDSLAGELDPIGFTVAGPSQSARVVVMPMRI